MPETSKTINAVYEEAQQLKLGETRAAEEELNSLSNNWQDANIPLLQCRVVELQLENLRKGIVDPVFAVLGKALRAIPPVNFSLFDGAAASGYYSEVIHTLDPRAITYQGSDYSEAMARTARANYPKIPYLVQDLTNLAHPDRSFDVVLLSGVLEHIPRYREAISEACRLARKYIILHRAPLTTAPEHCHTIGSQYNIRTPRTWYSRKLLLAEFKANGYAVIWESKIYPEAIPFTRRFKQALKRLVKGRREEIRTYKTLVFARKE
ncbi:MAG: class I SAM-dependent methyltransferase [Planctomycetes bacterium]|nr:class I SAM-dependent methyltransferase [Planctomycetota bacterium]